MENGIKNGEPSREKDKIKFYLAQSPILLYKRTFVISLVYKYKIFNVGKNYNDINKNKRQLYKIF